MIKKIGAGILILVLAFLGSVASRDGNFRYERSGVINAPAEKIFPYLSSFKLGSEWSPYEKADPDMKKNVIGPDGQVGSVMEFEGANGNSGSGKLEFLKIVPNESVDLKLTMTKPFYGENLIEYKLTPEEGGTRFSWILSGKGGFVSKLMTVVMDCEKMMGDQFNGGIGNLKAIVEAQK